MTVRPSPELHDTIDDYPEGLQADAAAERYIVDQDVATAHKRAAMRRRAPATSL